MHSSAERETSGHDQTSLVHPDNNAQQLITQHTIALAITVTNHEWLVTLAMKG
ncbi:MAG: hypothetical protein MJY59_03580 [Bacteroidaceae bacterium]|nr:hypothetical protein [Bacteroidaceae bacterium]